MANKPSSSSSSPAKKSVKATASLSPEELIKRLKSVEEALKEKNGASLTGLCRAENIPTPLLLLGTQHVRIKRTIDWIREHFFPKRSPGSGSYFGTELSSKNSIENILSSLNNLSLFSENDLVVIYDADKIKAPVAKLLAPALISGSGACAVILSAESLDNKSPLLKEISAHSTKVVFDDMAPVALRRWIEREAVKSAGVLGIDPDAAALLIKNYNNDVSAISRELEKLALLTAPGENITSRLVSQLSLRSPETTSFALLAQIARRNSAGAATLVEDLLSQGLHPLQISAFLSKAYRMLIVQKSGSQANASAELNNAWMLRNLSSCLGSFSLQELKSALRLLATLDFQLKDSGLPHPLALSLAVGKLSARRTD